MVGSDWTCYWSLPAKHVGHFSPEEDATSSQPAPPTSFVYSECHLLVKNEHKSKSEYNSIKTTQKQIHCSKTCHAHTFIQLRLILSVSTAARTTILPNPFFLFSNVNLRPTVRRRRKKRAARRALMTPSPTSHNKNNNRTQLFGS